MESTPPAAYPRSEPRPLLRRNLLGWAVLVALFALVVSTALLRSFGREVTSDPAVKTAERSLESSVSLASAASQEGGGKSPVAQSSRRSLEDLRTSLGTASGEAAFLRVVISRELGERPSAGDLRGARAVPSALRPSAELATEDHPKPDAIPKAANGESGERFSVRLARAQARERAGVPRAEARRDLVRPGYLLRFGLFAIGLLGASALAIGLWLWYVIGRASGSFAPKGLPSLPMTPAEADRFGLRAAGLFAGFLLGGTAVSLASSRLHLPGWTSSGLQVIFFGAIALYTLRLPQSPQVPHLSWRGFNVDGERLGERALWGMGAAIANIPVLLIVTLASHALVKNVPPPTHPSTEALLNHPSAWVVLQTFFLASVCAPIWEETMFRGLLFQGLVGVRLGGKAAPIVGALVSSLLFAAIHPQGIAAWPGLATVALMSCALLAQTRSLVPSMVMHATHNGLTLLMTLVAGPIVAQLPGWTR